MIPGVVVQTGDAKVFRAFRRRHLMTQKRLAELLGISLRTVQFIEGGYVKPTYSTVGKFRALQARHGGK